MKNSEHKKRAASGLQEVAIGILETKLNDEQKALLDEFNRMPVADKDFSESKHKWWETA